MNCVNCQWFNRQESRCWVTKRKIRRLKSYPHLFKKCPLIVNDGDINIFDRIISLYIKIRFGKVE
jgi:hypothetical protein